MLGVRRGLGGGRRQEVVVSVRGQQEVMELFWLTCVIVKIPAVICTIVLQDVTTQRNWIEGIWHVSVLFLPIAYKSTIISKI